MASNIAARLAATVLTTKVVYDSARDIRVPTDETTSTTMKTGAIVKTQFDVAAAVR